MGAMSSMVSPGKTCTRGQGVCGAMEQKSGLGENGKTCIKSSYLFLFPLLSLSSPFPLRQARQKNGSSQQSDNGNERIIAFPSPTPTISPHRSFYLREG